MSDLETERLFLRPYRREDLDLVASLYGDPEVTAFTKLGHRTRAQTEAILDEYLETWREKGFGMRALYRKVDLNYVGECGLFLLPDGAAALRYALLRPFWGQGFTSEAVAATIDDAFTATPLERVLSVVQTRNPTSGRVMEKAGWRIARRKQEGEVELLIYERTRAEWRSKHDCEEQNG